MDRVCPRILRDHIVANKLSSKNIDLCRPRFGVQDILKNIFIFKKNILQSKVHTVYLSTLYYNVVLHIVYVIYCLLNCTMIIRVKKSIPWVFKKMFTLCIRMQSHLFF